MKLIPTTLTILCLSYFKSSSQPQIWPEPGGHWTYNISTWSPPYGNFPVEMVTGPTINIGGIDCREIIFNSPQMNCSLSDTFYTYRSNDTVYQYLTASNSFAILYNFNASVGDTMTIYVNNVNMTGKDSVVLRVDSIAILNLNGFNKKDFYMQPIPCCQNFLFDGEVIEDIGNMSFLFPQFFACDPLTVGLRCYEDSIIGLYNPLGYSCDTIIYTGLNNLTEETKIEISPNPVNEILFINNLPLLFSDFKCEIIDINGRTSTIRTTQKPNNSIDVSNINSGVYLLKLIAKDKVVSRTFLKL